MYILWEALHFLLNCKEYKEYRKSLFSTLFNVKYAIGEKLLIESSIEIGIRYDVFNIDSNFIRLSDRAIHNFRDLENVTIFIRIFLRDYLLTNKPFWLFFFDEDSNVFEDLIPDKWVEILNTGNLLNFKHEDVVNWWTDLFDRIEIDDEKFRKEIGNLGEELTIKYESERLSSEGITTFDDDIRWMAKISDKYGYDIASLSGSLNPTNPRKPIMIEVKATQSSNLSKNRFFVTRNEWTTAVNNPGSYFFYLWFGIDLKNRKTKSGPKIILAEDLLKRFPVDQNRDFQWELCTVSLNSYDLP